ncbi:MAG TPA: hypothetical protein VGG15_06970 [Terriglobales bacterium]|jgi:hypothetical protein
MSKFSEIHDAVRADWSKLQACWQATRAQWRDEVADDFERRRWQEWEQGVPAFLRALEHLDETVSRALRETE